MSVGDGDQRLLFREPARALACAEAWVTDRIEGRSPAEPWVSFALWIPDRPTACLGLSQSAARELYLERVERAKVAVVRRASGGGAVWLTSGSLCWEAWATETVLAGAGGIRSAYGALSRGIVAGLAALGLSVFPAGISDLSVRVGESAVCKIAGLAQYRRRGWVWVHGSLLVNADVEEFGRWLRPPSAEPEYRSGRDHRSFCTTVAEASGSGTTMEQVVAVVREGARGLGWQEATLEEAERSVRLYGGKYAHPAWNLRGERQGNEPSPSQQ